MATLPLRLRFRRPPAAGAPLPARPAVPVRAAGLDADAVAVGHGSTRRTHRRPARPHFPGTAPCRHHRRGRNLLPQSRNRPRRDARGDRAGRRRHRRGARRFHHHPADGQEPVSLARAQLRAQGAGNPAGALDQPGPAQAACSRNLSQYRRMGPERRVRRRGGGALGVRQIGARSHRAGGRGTRRGPAEPGTPQRPHADHHRAPACRPVRAPRRRCIRRSTPASAPTSVTEAVPL